MERRYLSDLENWLSNPRRKPLLVYGARQVGKSYLIKDIFAEKHFPGSSCIYIDCQKEHAFVNFVTKHMNVEDVLNYLSLEKGVDITDKTLLIFDEVQECLPLITLLKYFCQERREIPIIATGSMVRIKMKRKSKGKKFLFPVGKINVLYIYPLDFEEYLWNRNQKLFKAIVDAYSRKAPLEPSIHEMALDVFYEYLLLGGMPEVVSTFLSTKSHKAARDVLRDIYADYLSDMDLYQASPEALLRSKAVFRNIYSELNKENRNFKPSNIEKGLKNRDLRSPIDWLTAAFLVIKSHMVNERVTTPLNPDLEGTYRLYLSDMGIFSYQSGSNAAIFIDGDQRDTLSGVFYENFVADSLYYRGQNLFYWKGKRNGEIEFLLQNHQDVHPVDVKKNRGSLSSLTEYRFHNPHTTAFKVSKSPYGFDKERNVANIPFYSLFCLLREIWENNL